MGGTCVGGTAVAVGGCEVAVGRTAVAVGFGRVGGMEVGVGPPPLVGEGDPIKVELGVGVPVRLDVAVGVCCGEEPPEDRLSVDSVVGTGEWINSIVGSNVPSKPATWELTVGVI